ncbi:MAG TPA: response regulator transcription factor [Gemmataceae bacterium]|jgi:DNA-binding NarL/FixJ family response regulator|nr:response regulator transcription factor [Gemmataceae bacterium]
MSISIVLADDHPLVRRGLREALEAEPGFAVVGESGDGLETLRIVEQLEPDVLVLDLMMPSLNGLDILPLVRQRSPRSRVVVLSMFGNEGMVLQALRNGAVAYALKGCDSVHAVEAVRRAAAGQRYLGPGISERAFDAYQGKADAALPDPHDLLTPRERQVLQLAAEGYANPDIAARLFISPRTAEMHRGNALRKLGLRKQADLIGYAIRRGMIPAVD